MDWRKKMIALRQIEMIENDSITIHLPAEFSNYQQAEVIILPLEETLKHDSTEQFIQRFAGSIMDFPEIESEGEIQERDNKQFNRVPDLILEGWLTTR